MGIKKTTTVKKSASKSKAIGGDVSFIALVTSVMACGFIFGGVFCKMMGWV